ncbi:hypothetical protein J2X31_003587 [Flavobacterium arsenatis]|uniref:Uncharacterized protein n=1 Tax=Flavobacterium arsenatis TaxID=1484332 RepID=A0ABU1TUJ6_9FLAO|nr:hypothetical protein [Flavobacterium arsenatis]MDR6969554.1 hypothetical protein [Flavobacterium arsenatis]
MIVSNIIFYLILAGITVLIFGIFLFIEHKYNKEDFKQKAIFAIVPLCIIIYMFCPKIYLVQDCKTSKEEVMLFPTQGFTYGKGKCYVINQSSENLGVVTYVYGSPSQEKIDEYVINTEILPKSTVMIPKGQISYLLEPAPSSVSTKSDYEFHHRLFCKSQEAENETNESEEDGAYSNE